MPGPERLRDVVRWLLGAALVFAGVSHLTTLRDEFQAQVPDWFPLDADFTVLASGVVEIVLGLALIVLARHRVLLGWITAGFFVAVFPGNVSQFVDQNDAFGLDSDTSRFVRLLFQPALIALALWSTGAWRAWRQPDHTPEDQVSGSTSPTGK